MTDSYRQVLLRIHRGLFPERYYDADEMERQGFRDEWDSGTIEWVAADVEHALKDDPDAELRSGYRRLTEYESVQVELLSLRAGQVFTRGPLRVTRTTKPFEFCVVGDGEDEGTDVSLEEAAMIVVEEG
jgi:hypothetical protein